MAHIAETGVRKRKTLNSQYINQIGIYENDRWYDIVDGLPNPIMKRGFIDVWDRPGLGVTFRVQAAKARLSEEDRHFFD